MPRQHIMHFAPFSLPELVDELRGTHFPDLKGYIGCAFTTHGRSVARAYIAPFSTGRTYRGHIDVNVALNMPETPMEVMRGILKHELLHFEIRPERRGRWVIEHPEAFCLRELDLLPEGPMVNAWLIRRFGDAYVSDERHTFIRCRQVRKGGWMPVAKQRKSSTAP